MKQINDKMLSVLQTGYLRLKAHSVAFTTVSVFVIGCGVGYHMGKKEGIIIPVVDKDTKVVLNVDAQSTKQDQDLSFDQEEDQSTSEIISVAELNFLRQEQIHAKIGHATDLLRPTEKTLEVRGGDTLVAILTKEGIEKKLAHDVVRSMRCHCDPRRLKPGQIVTLALKPSEATEQGPELLKVSLKIDETKDVHVSKSNSGNFDAWMEKKEVKKELAFASGKIENSLFGASTQAGVPATIVVDVIRALSHRVDLQRDIQPGDEFEIAYDRVVDLDGKPVSDGKANFVLLHTKGKDIKLYRHTTKSGESDFYLEDGSALKNGFMRTPIDGARLSSNFGMRKHPIHKFTRMHRGVDFAAPRGTPIYAAGDGVITKMGFVGGYGRYVQIKHNAEFATAYAHMHRFGEGLRVGSKVRQGQKIGEVGSTGSSSGCHLHYEVLRYGQQINPKSVKNVGGRKLEGAELKAFLVNVGSMSVTLANLKSDLLNNSVAQNVIVGNEKKPDALLKVSHLETKTNEGVNSILGTFENNISPEIKTIEKTTDGSSTDLKKLAELKVASSASEAKGDESDSDVKVYSAESKSINPKETNQTSLPIHVELNLGGDLHGEQHVGARQHDPDVKSLEVNEAPIPTSQDQSPGLSLQERIAETKPDHKLASGSATVS